MESTKLIESEEFINSIKPELQHNIEVMRKKVKNKTEFLGQIVTKKELKKIVAKDKIISNFTLGAEQYLQKQNFTRVFVPHIVGVTGACENLNTLFKIPYFNGQHAFTAQTGQLHLEMRTFLHEKVYCWLQSMRAESESDGRHLTEFPLLEIEFQGNLDELIQHLENVIKAGLEKIVKKNKKELKLFKRDPEYFKNLKFNRMKYEEVIEVLKLNGYPDLEFGADLKRDHEAKITDMFGPTFVTHYPLEIKFFNMLQNEEDPRVVNSVDLLLPFSGEASGAAEREHDYYKLKDRLITSPMYQQLIDQGLKFEDFEWYLNHHAEREIKLHSGAGMGWARIIQFVLGLEDIRDAVQYPTDAAKVW